MPLDGSVRQSPAEFDNREDDAGLPSRDWYALPVLVGTSILLASLLAAMVLRNAETRALEAAVDAALDTITTEIEQGVDRQLYGVITLAWKWDWSDDNAQENWTSEARTLIEKLPLLHGIVWLDKEYTVLVREPSMAGGVMDIATPDGDIIRGALKLSQKKQRIIGVITEDPSQNKFLMVTIPVLSQGKPAGFAIGAYGLESLLSKIFVAEPSGFRVEVSDEKGPIWRSPGETPLGVPVRYGTASTLNMGWDITVSPGFEVLDTYLTWLPFAIGLGGVFFGVLMGIALYMGVDSRRKAQRLQLFNLRLQDEMALRDRAEKVTSETEAELVETLNSLPVHVWSAKVASDGQYVPRRMSTVLAGISGRPADFFDGSVESWLQIAHPDDVPRLRNVVEDILSGRKETVDFEYQLVRTDGSIRYMSDSVRTTHIESGRRLDGVSRDVTEVRESQEERLRLESRFQQSQRLDSLGVLAGGVAHDFNNLLVAMLGHARLAEEDLPVDSPVHHNLKSVIKAARQAGDLCGQMLAYAGKVPIDTQPIELENVVQEIGDLLRASIPSSTSIRYSLDKEVPCIQADASQIRQVVLNLITNASESIRETGGEIMLSVRSIECEPADFSKMTFFEDLKPGQYVVLTVSDTGSGMNEQTRAKLFEPFYTTKFAGRGLGLAAVAGIVRGHRGAIRIESEIDRGSTISVFFPSGTKDAVSRTAPSRLDLPVRKEDGKVLLVEDEDAARELARIVLERAGLEVVEASDGVEAIAIFQAQPDEFNWVLLDLTMPRMDGVETYSRLRKIRADVQVILCSGYPEHAAMARFADLGLAGFLKKPYEPEQLLDCLECVAGPGDSA